ncbi:hypothetical protein MNBD_GAMMA16-172 [hydrothermal vent metagenome]|uniref:Uncharacterized protein n=1 Tax=hydrothermal vent metagenome TaxID=652676 RepID=A0A3B0Z0K8_9ZZZZ
MNMIIIQIAVLLTVVAFVIFLAIDDKKNQKIREEEDREELEKVAAQNKLVAEKEETKK